MVSPQRTCEHVKADGERCRGTPQTGSAFCWFHDPAKERDRAEGRKAGGRSRMRRGAVLGPDAPALSLATPAEQLKTLEFLLNKVARGELDVKIGNFAVYAASTARAIVEASDLEKRLQVLEALQAKRK